MLAGGTDCGLAMFKTPVSKDPREVFFHRFTPAGRLADREQITDNDRILSEMVRPPLKQLFD